MLDRTLLLILLVSTVIIQTGCSGSVSTKKPAQSSTIPALKSQPSKVKISALRLASLQQTSRSIGTQAGLAWSSKKINAFLESQKKNLDRIFNFTYLILNQNVLPPVLVEGRGSLNIADDFTIRISDRDYQIIQPPRFITTPPNWRNYIWMNYKKPEIPHIMLLPQNKEERYIWNINIKIGWNEGLNQATQIFSANLARLERDYKGMILYRKLLAQRMITPPYVSQAELGITGGGNDLHINDRVLRITAIPQLQSDIKNWLPVISGAVKSNENKVSAP